MSITTPHACKLGLKYDYYNGGSDPYLTAYYYSPQPHVNISTSSIDASGSTNFDLYFLDTGSTGPSYLAPFLENLTAGCQFRIKFSISDYSATDFNTPVTKLYLGASYVIGLKGNNAGSTRLVFAEPGFGTTFAAGSYFSTSEINTKDLEFEYGYKIDASNNMLFYATLTNTTDNVVVSSVDYVDSTKDTSDFPSTYQCYFTPDRMTASSNFLLLEDYRVWNGATTDCNGELDFTGTPTDGNSPLEVNFTSTLG